MLALLQQCPHFCPWWHNNQCTGFLAWLPCCQEGVRETLGRYFRRLLDSCRHHFPSLHGATWLPNPCPQEEGWQTPHQSLRFFAAEGTEWADCLCVSSSQMGNASIAGVLQPPEVTPACLRPQGPSGHHTTCGLASSSSMPIGWHQSDCSCLSRRGEQLSDPGAPVSQHALPWNQAPLLH